MPQSAYPTDHPMHSYEHGYYDHMAVNINGKVRAMKTQIVYKTKYMTFMLKETKPKTQVWGILTNPPSEGSYSVLGEIRWYPQWRQYCFFPKEFAVYNVDCLNEIIRFIDRLRQERASKKKSGCIYGK